MPRPLRPQFAGAIYHINTRGNRRCAIYRDDHDRVLALSLLLRTIDRYGWECDAWCQLTTHYHLLVRTPLANIAAGMRDYNARYAECFNARYSLTGHLFEGRYHHKLVTSQAQLLNTYRYIARQPVVAMICDRAADWAWSSYAGLVAGREGLLYKPPSMLADFAGREGLRDLRRFIETGP